MNLDIHVDKAAPRQLRKASPALPVTLSTKTLKNLLKLSPKQVAALPAEEYLSYFSPADRAFVRRALNLPTVTKKR